jgi:NTP pyrophosphatase (non-canonical NTP hydrolase)
MDIAKLQSWAKDNFGAALDPLPTDYGVARLLVQTGQLADAVLNKRDVDKELADVVFVLLALANRAGVDLDATLHHALFERSPHELLQRISR